MNIGIHLSTFTRRWNEDVFQYVSVAKEIGYDGVEFPLVDPFAFDYTYAKKLLAENNLKCTCGTGLNPIADISSVNEEKRLMGIEHLKKAIDICNHLESDTLGGVLYAPWGLKKSRAEAKEDILRSIDTLKDIDEYAQEKGVTLALEILNRYESYFINTVSEGLSLLKKIAGKNIKLHFDTFHAHIEEENMYEAILKGGDNIQHIHFCENTRGVPGTGQIDWSNVKKALKEINYDKWIMIENFVMSDCEVGNDVAIWHNRELNGFTAAYKAYQFTNNLLN